jgi:XTP/dITP diphosphohydrolase
MTAEPNGEPLLELVRVMDRLRSPGGCPWDAKQTHRSLVEYLVEECYETVEAIELDDQVALREELGDVLLQVVFHSRIAQESVTEPFSIDDVAAGLVTKLVERHPHVFGDESATTAEHVEARWQEMKAAQKGRTSVTDGIPNALPALVLAQKLLRRAANGAVTVDVASPEARVAAAWALDSLGGDEALGDLLLAIVDLATQRNLDPEASLRAAIRAHRTRILDWES